MTITAREIHLAIKKGQTSAEFAAKYDITEAELFDYIRDRMNAGAKELIREFQKNDKKRRKKEESEPETLESTTTTPQEETEVTTPVERENTGDTNVGKAETLQTTSKLSALRESESEFSRELIELEKAHEAMAQRRREILEKAKETNQAVIRIQEQLLEAQKVVEDLALEYDILAEDMTANTAERRSYEDLLEEIRGEIEELSQITAHVKADGTIECSEPEFLRMFTAESESAELTILMAMPEAEEFTVRQLKGIAKARLLAQIGVNVTFDLPEAHNLI